MRRPTKGQLVRYVTPDGRQRTAVVIGKPSKHGMGYSPEDQVVELAIVTRRALLPGYVLKDTDRIVAKHDEGRGPDTWHWPAE